MTLFSLCVVALAVVGFGPSVVTAIQSWLRGNPDKR